MKKICLSITIILMLCLTGMCFAAEELTIGKDTSYDSGTRTLSFLLNDNRPNGAEPDLSEISFDGISLEQTDYKSLSDSGIPLVFCFVVDTTPTAFNYQTKIPAQIAEALAGYRGNKADKYYLISYDSEVHAPIGPKSADSLFDGLKYAGGYNIVGDYSEALLKAIDVLDSHDGFCKKVIILITDGNQVKKPFLPDGESDGLLEKLELAGYPVYSFGLMQSETEEYDEASLKKVQSISSAAGGMYISYKENHEPAKEFYNQIRRSGVISGIVPETYGRDTEEPAAMTFKLMKSGGAEIKTLTADVILPVIEGNSTDIPAETSGETQTETETQTEISEESEENETWLDKAKSMMENTFGKNWVYILCGGLLLIVLIILVLIISGNSRKSKKNASGTRSSKSKQESQTGELSSDQTDFMQIPPTSLGNADSSKPSLVYLTDLTHGVTCSSSLKNGQTAAFGRLNDKEKGVIGLGGDPHISRRQFTLTNENGKIILEDLQATNGTYLNSERIMDKAVVRTGDTIRIGEIAGEREFRVNITEL